MLAISGLVMMPAILFNPYLTQRVILFLLFWFLAWLAGKRNNPLITLSIVFFIVVFNLTVPHGLELFSIGRFRITTGALALGIHRAVTLAGLIMLSRLTIRHDLKLPGLFGELIGESLRIFGVIMSQKQRITRKNLIADLDQMMLDLSDNASTDSPSSSAATPQASRTKPAGFVILALVTLLVWGMSIGIIGAFINATVQLALFVLSALL